MGYDEKKKTKLYLGVSCILVIIFIISLLIYIKSIQYYNYAEFSADYMNTDIGGYYRTFDDGDTVHVKDRISRMEFSNTSSNTRVWFYSTGSELTDPFLLFRSNLEESYSVDDLVVITLHIYEIEHEGITMEIYSALTDDNIRPANL